MHISQGAGAASPLLPPPVDQKPISWAYFGRNHAIVSGNKGVVFWTKMAHTPLPSPFPEKNMSLTCYGTVQLFSFLLLIPVRILPHLALTVAESCKNGIN